MENIKVLDVSRGYPASLAAMYLADFGAEVIRVDPEPDQNERAAAFSPRNRNKKSIILDLKKTAHREVLYRLVKTADVLIENSRPGVMKRLKCDYDTLRLINLRLIYCACSGYGQEGPYASLPGHDMNYISLNGALSLVGPRGGPPYFPANMVADIGGCVLHAAIGILIALVHQQKTGQGQFIDISYTDGAMATMTTEITRYLYTGIVPRRGETRMTAGSLWAQIYRCRDGEYFTIACAEQNLWDNFCRVMGREDLRDKREAVGEEKDRAFAELSQVFATRTRNEWFDFFKDKDVCAAPVNNVDEAIKDPQIAHRQMILEFDHPTLGKVRQLGIPIKMSHTPGNVRRLGVPAGTDTEEILAGLGYSETEIAKLVSAE